MNIKELPSVQFTSLSDATKKLINAGEWFLYEINSDNPHVRYYLSTDSMNFFLSHNGQTIEKTLYTPDNLAITNQINFNDLPKNEFLRNISLKWA